MKKRMLVLVFACFMLTLPLTACGGNVSSSTGADAAAQQEEAPQPPDLTGEWVQVNSDSEDSYQTATITADTITVNWNSPDTTALYWAGSFEAPTTADEPYTWDSANDTEQTANELLASPDETKTFTCEDGQISYSVSAMDVTTTVKLEKK